MYGISCVTSITTTSDKISHPGPFHLITSHSLPSDKDRGLRPTKDRNHFVIIKNKILLYLQQAILNGHFTTPEPKKWQIIFPPGETVSIQIKNRRFQTRIIQSDAERAEKLQTLLNFWRQHLQQWHNKSASMVVLKLFRSRSIYFPLIV